MGLISNILNMEFRDFVRNSIYPFTDTSDLATTNGTMLPIDLILDAVLYPLPRHPLPYYMSNIRTIGGNLLFEVKDASNEVIGLGTYVEGEEAVYLKDDYEAVTGCLLINLDLIDYIKQLARVQQNFVSTHTTFIPSVCFPIVDNRCVGINVNQNLIKAYATINPVAGDNVTITSDNKVSITVEAPNLNMDLGKPIKTINGISFKNGHVWIMAHEDSSMRVLTTENNLVVGLNKDF